MADTHTETADGNAVQTLIFRTFDLSSLLRLVFRRVKGGLFLAAALLALAHSPMAKAEVFYGVTGNGIYSVDSVSGGPATLLVTFAAPLASGATLATRPSDGMLFYLDTQAANPNLWRWDPSTPAVSPVLIGTPGATTVGVIRLGFDVAGNLFAMNSGAGSSLWTLDPATGAILSVTPASGYLNGNLPGGGDLCLHPSTGVLYMVAQTNLFTVNSTGLVTLVGAMTGLPGSATGCAFDRNGKLAVSPGATLFTVNLGTLVATAMPVAAGVAFGDLATNPNPNIVADLRLTKTASNLTPGSTVSFTLTVTNDGPNRATDVRVLDALPAGLTFVSATPSQGSYSAVAIVGPPAFPAGTWRVGVLNNGASATLTINANVTDTTPIINTAQVSNSDQFDPDSTPNNGVAAEDDQASVTVTPSPDIRVTKTATSSFAVGTNSTYSISVNNTLGSLTTGANTYTVTDNLQPGLTFVSAAGTGWTCALNTPVAGDNVVGGNRMVCTSTAAMLPGASNPDAITLTVLPAAAAAPSVNNSAVVSGGGEPASNNGNNSSTIATTVCATSCPDLVAVKTSAASFTVGAPGSYALSVRNSGGQTTGATNYVISDTLPTGLTLTTAFGGAGWTIGAGWTCTVGAVNGSQVTCNSSTPILPGATSSTIVFPVNVANTVANCVAPPTTPPTLCAVNPATVSGGGEPAAVTGNNTTTLTTPVLAFDLTVTKVKTTLANFVLGVNTDTYTLTVNNVGGVATTGTYTVTDTLPTGLTLNAAPTVGAGWTCTANTPLAGDNIAGGGRVVCTSATVINPAASSTTIVFPVQVAAAAAPSVTNTASVSNPNESPNLVANNASSVTSLVNAPNLVVTKSHNGNFTVGTNGAYTLTVTNLGAQATTAATVTVVDTLPAGLTFFSASGTNWTCTLNAPVAGDNVVGGQRMVCTRTTIINAFASAEPITLTVAVGAAAATASPVTNIVSVAGGNEPAGNNGNNTDSDITNVYYSPVITKAFLPISIPAGGTSVMTLTISNPAGNPVSLAGLAVVDPFPAGMSIATTPGFSNTCGGTVSPGNAAGDTQLSLTGGATGGQGTSCVITVNVTSVTIGANVNTTGQVSSTNSGTGPGASATLTVTAPGNPILTKLSSPNPVGVNQPAALTFTISNKATATADMGFTDTLPVGVVISTPNGLGGTCTSTGGAALVNTATAGTGVITVTGVDLAANAICTVIVNIQSASAGSYVNDTARISALAGGLTAATLADTLIVQATTLTKGFAPSTVNINTNSTLTFTITNGADTPGQTGLAFTETLPTGVVVAVAPLATQCGGTVAATVNTGIITVSGGVLAASQASCTISVAVRSASAGVYNNLPANVTGVSANIVNIATATLTVASPSLLFLKSVAVTSDPLNLTVNPKNIPGAEVLYTLRVTNTGAGTVDSNTLVIVDPIPANSDLFVGDLGAVNSGPIAFVQGTPTSALTFTYTALNSGTDDVDFFSDVGCTVPVALPTVPYDASVRCIRLNPKGTMAGTGGGSPFFDLNFRVRIR